MTRALAARTGVYTTCTRPLDEHQDYSGGLCAFSSLSGGFDGFPFPILFSPAAGNTDRWLAIIMES